MSTRFTVSAPSDDPSGVRITHNVIDTQRDNQICAVSADGNRARSMADEAERLGDAAYHQGRAR